MGQTETELQCERSESNEREKVQTKAEIVVNCEFTIVERCKRFCRIMKIHILLFC